jgi:ABC-2 type transport system permease protein
MKQGKQLWNLIRKDFLLLIRDAWGAVLLFLMPWTLVVLMTYLQDSAFRSVNENRIPLCLLDADRDSLGAMITRQILASGIFDVSTSQDGRRLTPAELEKAVYEGKYMIGIIIPENTTGKLRETVRRQVENAFSGGDPAALSPPGEAPGIKLLIDPTVKHSFRTSIAGAVKENALAVQNALLLGEISRQVSALTPVAVRLDMEAGEWFGIDEAYPRSGKYGGTVPDSTQHNVPAWSMFAIFFTVISLAGNMIRERESGCYGRLMTMPCSLARYIAGKTAVYLAVCLLQMALMIFSGIFLMPLLGLPALQLGSSPAAMILMSVSSSLAAIGYGLAIGAIARTDQQASVFGAVSVVILAALGGVWIPTFLMPRFMKIISYASPLNWGLSGFNGIFVRDAGCIAVLPFAAASLAFSAAAFMLAFRRMKRERE